MIRFTTDCWQWPSLTSVVSASFIMLKKLESYRDSSTGEDKWLACEQG